MVEKEEILEHLKGYIDEKFSVLKEKFKGQELAPTIELHLREESGEYSILPIPQAHRFFQNDTTKDMLKPFVKTITEHETIKTDWKEMGITLVAVVVISDVFWAHHDISHLDDSERDEFINSRPKPSQDPNRTEAIMFACSLKDDSFTRVYPYTRNGTITFGEPEDMSGGVGEGRMANLFPE